MTGQVVGYVRVSILDQKTDRQLVDIHLHRTFTDHASDKDTDSPELAQMVAYVREGDTVVVHAMDRLVRIFAILLNVMGSFAEFERALIRERQREGIAVAKVKGVYKGRRRALSPDQVEQVRLKVASGAKKAALAREFNVSRETVQRISPRQIGASHQSAIHRS
ncbi:recombinase family protein [Bradyrhizobium elkanii]|uniref:recombinase family protein n=1 Tax=Bradyrhizobium elkanii TaxID=29448 RepID=UPI0021696E81|nr:recombinase family protein [Bradyrhizobium elkanii]MCS3695020.1 DNA invertase Pin-like site-specific DNA recombinase [Bradyrhizobium elkanii]